MVVSPGEAVVVWNDLECGRYTADLALWRELAAGASRRGGSARVLDIGAGTGRVALDLARAGHAVTAVDIDRDLLSALEERAGGLPVETVQADASGLSLRSGAFDLCLVPMQTLQLLRGAAARAGLFAGARAHLRAGAVFAAAIVTEVDEFDSRGGALGPSPERTEIRGTLYLSRAVLVARRDGVIRIERERLVGAGADGDVPPVEHDLIELEELGEELLWEELRAAGLEPLSSRVIPETDEHSGSLVVMARA